MDDRLFAPAAVESMRPRLYLVRDSRLPPGVTPNPPAKISPSPDQDSDNPSTLAPVPASAITPGTSLIDRMASAVSRYASRRRQIASLRELQSLDNYLLRDIGIEPGDLWGLDLPTDDRARRRFRD